MKRGEEIRGTVARVDFPNKGIFEAEGKRVTVKGARPGEEVLARIRKNREDSAEASLLEVLTPSPLQTEDACPHFGICGGCYYQGFPARTQLDIKEAQVRRLLERAAGGPLPFESAKPAPSPCGYRNKMEFSFGDAEKGGEITLGLHRKGSFYDVIDVPDFEICDADFSLAAAVTRQWAREYELPYYHKGTKRGYLRHLLVRKSRASGEVLLGLVTTSQTEDLPETEEGMLFMLALALKNAPWCGSLAGILHIVNDSPADAVLCDRMELLYGQDHITEEVLGLRFDIGPFSFFQTNTAGAEVLYRVVRDYAGETAGRRIFDLYSGTGTIAQILAPVAESVTGVEIVEEAVAAARTAAARNGLNNCTFIAGDVLKVLSDLPEGPDVMVLDPPRDGIHPKALPGLIAFGAPVIVYVSCKPTSLARDLPLFIAAGYQVKRVCVVDLFPGTTGIETVCLLVLRNPVTHINIDVDVEELVQDKRGQATYEQIREYVKEQTGLHVTNLNIAQIKRKCGIIERENYNLPKSEDSKQPNCTKEKEEAIKDAFRHFGIIS
ncbi:MAG: 23S rRNA (uracil(1939)-C(5))-methyltransferase RlmD [Lachnospiraceae bacterium]|nr:23S rRNA (uracil(1939)-C(5))-methyltransferase RlmD [Lachnospiraceae bacterium]